MYRFAPLYPGVWIRPYNKNENLEAGLKDIINKKHCSIIKYHYLKGIGKKEVIRLWKLDRINKTLGSGLKLIDDKNSNLASLSPEKAFIDHMVTGGKIVNLLFKDPLLPWEFLPENWNGKQLREKFSQWIKAVAEISKSYWGKIYE
jgi:DNA-binding transcriptional regulator PaaX